MRRDRIRFFASAFLSLVVTAAAVLSPMAAATSAAALTSVEGGEDMAAGGAHGKMVAELFDSGVPHSQTEVLAALYGDAQDRIREILLHPKGLTQASMEFRQARAAQQIEQIRRIVRGLGQPTLHWTGENVGRAFRDGVARAELQAAEAGIHVGVAGSRVGATGKGVELKGSFHRVDPTTVEVFARDITRDLNIAANAMANRAERVLRQTAQVGLDERSIDALLARGVIEGTPRETTRALRDELVRVNNGQLVTVRTKNGDTMNFDARHYAELVARTKTRQATVVARHERLKGLGLDLVSIVGGISDNFCTAFLGQVFSLSGNHPRYPALAELPGGGPALSRAAAIYAQRPLCCRRVGGNLRAGVSDDELLRSAALRGAVVFLTRPASHREPAGVSAAVEQYGLGDQAGGPQQHEQGDC